MIPCRACYGQQCVRCQRWPLLGNDGINQSGSRTSQAASALVRWAGSATNGLAVSAEDTVPWRTPLQPTGINGFVFPENLVNNRPLPIQIAIFRYFGSISAYGRLHFPNIVSLGVGFLRSQERFFPSLPVPAGSCPVLPSRYSRSRHDHCCHISSGSL